MSDKLPACMDAVAREAIIKDVTGFSVERELRDFRHGSILRAAIYPELPEALWPHVPLDVMVPVRDPDTGEIHERFEAVSANALTLHEHQDRALPNLLNVDVVSLSNADLSRFNGYCLRFYEYLQALHGHYEEIISTMTQQRKELLALLPSCCYEGTPKYEAERAAKADPFVRELERSLISDRQVMSTLERRMSALSERMKQNSRDQYRRHDYLGMDRVPHGAEGSEPDRQRPSTRQAPPPSPRGPQRANVRLPRR